jgi:hypothetical protein
MSELRDHIEEWITKVSKVRPELGNFSICPFAKKATYHIIETKIDDIQPLDGYDVVFFIVEDHLNFKTVRSWVKIYNQKYPEWAFFEDCAKNETFINGIPTSNGKYNIITMQNREKLHQARSSLLNSEYYKSWDDSLLSDVVGDDYEMIKNRLKIKDF